MAHSPFLASANTNTTTQGSIWTVLVQPSFPDLVFEASALLTKGASAQQSGPKAINQPSEFSIQIKENAQALVGTGSSALNESGEVEDENENDGHDENEEVKQDTEEVRENKRKIVTEVWTKVQPSCFTKSDDRGKLELSSSLVFDQDRTQN